MALQMISTPRYMDAVGKSVTTQVDSDWDALVGPSPVPRIATQNDDREQTGNRRRMVVPSAIRTYVLAGKSIFTLVSLKTGARFTYKVRHKDADSQRGTGDIYFVSVLTGPNNDCDYEYLGCLFDSGERFVHGKKSRIQITSPSSMGFRYFWEKLGATGAVSAGIEFWHEGRCGRCNRLLTVPESLATGFGPECAGKL